MQVNLQRFRRDGYFKSRYTRQFRRRLIYC